MKKPIEIQIPEIHKAETQFRQKAPATVKHHLVYATCNYWKHPAFTIIEQYYNAKDAFICLLEINTFTKISIPMRFVLHDLYWLHQLNGTLQISEGTHRSFMLELPDEHYCITYIPPKKFLLHIPKGRHLLFYFVIKSNWLLRRPSTRMEELQSFLAKLRAKLMESESTKAFPIRAKNRVLMLSLFSQARRLPVEQDCVVYDKVISMLVRSLKDIERPQKPLILKSIQLLDAVHELIGERLGNGQPILIKELAGQFGVSTSYLNTVHRQRYQVSLKRYLTEQKFNYARMLLQEEGMDISTVSHLLGYNQPAAFTKQFTRYFGYPPSSSRTLE